MDKYFNTTNEAGNNLKENVEKAISQSKRILNFFRAHPNTSFNPFYIQNVLGMKDTPITSIRRAITTLTNNGDLEKTEKKSEGMYGRNNYEWRLKFTGKLF